MERIAQEVFSMRMMVVALFIFLASIGLATFVETVYDTQTAKLIIYNAGWFSILLLYLCAGMIANIFRYRMFRAEKISALTFHLAFIVMIIGAAITRYVGFEGIMLIREGESVNYMFSSEPYLLVTVSDSQDASPYEKPLLMSEAFDPTFEDDVPLTSGGKIKKKVTIECVDYKKNLIDSLVTSKKINKTALGFAISSMEPEFICEGEFKMLGDVSLSFEKQDAMPGIHIWKEGNKFKMKSVMGIRSLAMTQLREIRQSGGDVPDSLYSVVLPDSIITLEKETLYNVQEQQFVLKEIRKNTERKLMKSPIKDAGMDYLFVRFKMDGKKSPIYEVPGGIGRISYNSEVRHTWRGLNFTIGYGSKKVDMPFSVYCEDFRLERYSGSSQPSSFESDLIIIDEKNNKKIKKNLFMNHVVDYQGYRLFQSAYDPDEKGTHLSVNNDKWGTNISYLGYLLMGIGMILAFFAPAGRMRELLRKYKAIKEKRGALKTIAVIAMLSLGLSATAQEETIDTIIPVVNEVEHNEHDGHDHSGHDHATHSAETGAAEKPLGKPPKQGKFYIMTKEHSDELATLLVQSDRHKRYMPMHTMSSQILRKIYRSNKYKDYNAVQVVMSMHMYPDFWGHEKIIYVSSKGELRKKLGIEKYASYLDLIDFKTGEFKLTELYNKAFRTPESKRNEEEKQVIKLGEKLEIMYNILGSDWKYMRIIPVRGDVNKKWSTILQFEVESEEFKTAVAYFGALNDACMNSGGYGIASDNLKKLKAMQRKMSEDELPSEGMVAMEVRYNKMEVVKQSYRSYMVLGFILLVCFLITELSKNGTAPKWVRITQKVGFWLVILTTLYLGTGLVFRSLISGHVPWSDGYEALLFISFMTVIIGFIFYRFNRVILAAACLMAFFLLFVSSLNILDPEITQLQPVLKSYWLKIHVAIITGSYAPLGLAAFLGLINLVLYIARNQDNGKRLGLTIKQLTIVTEIAITIGVVMLTIGTFLGGIWANESWGRYWGWDPKETWALVAVLAYAVILHLRFIPGVKDSFTFNSVAFWGYATILFTFFGVNFYLVGLHSYANGEGLAEFPAWLSVVAAFFYIYTEIASYRNQRFKTKGDVIPMKYYTRKILILFSIIVSVALMMLIFKVSDFETVAVNTGMILGLIAITTGVQYLMGQRTKVPVEL
jgi:cytochrome c-type biogenesis protein CcsB